MRRWLVLTWLLVACSKPSNEREPDPSPEASAASASASAMPSANPGVSPVLFKDGQPMIKVVAIGYSGVADWVRKLQQATEPDRRGKFTHRIEDGWELTVFDFDSNQTLDGRPVHVHLFGHEGIGFIGQPGSAKDVVYKNAHAVIALASATDARDLAGVLEGDLTRMHSQGHQPSVLFAAPGKAAEQRPEGTTFVAVDWASKPTVALGSAVTLALIPHQQAE